LIINKEHINSLLQTRFSGKDRNNRLLADSNFWYSPQKKYLKLYTERDGIAYVKTEDLIKYDASYNGININYIHLLYKGKPYPFNVVFDENGILDSGEEIYFAGKRPEGDTTWFNVTANRSAFYLYIDSTQMSYQFKFFPFNVNVQSEITEVRIDKHIEEDHIYSVGYDDILNGTETVPGEGWFWDFISAIADTKLTDPWEKREFKLANFITPTDNPTESLEFSFKVQSRVFDKNPLAPNYHRLALMLNRDSVIKDFYLTRRTDSTINFSLSNDKIFAGSSQWGIVNKGAWKKDFTMVQTDDIWFDYLTIQGSIKPFAYKGTANFLVDNVNTDSKIIVPGFSDSLICVIDTSKNYIINLDNIRGTTFRAGAKSYSPAYSSISLNDSLFTDTLSGFHIAVLKPGNKFEVRNFTNLSDNISDYLNSLPSGSIIAIACNSNSDMPQGLKNTLNSLGSTRANEINSGNVWLFSVNKGQNTGVTEKLFVNGFGSFSGFIQHNSGSSFAGVHYLKKGTGYNLIYSDKHSCEKANIENVSQSDLRATNTKADLIVITADSLLSSANAYADYRKRTLGFNTIVTNIEDVYKEFSYGIKTPHAIRRFLKYAYENYQIPLPKYVVLWGNASWDVRNVMPNEKNFDVVPTFGYPVSDVWFTQFNDSNLYCQMIIGRIPCKTDSEGFIYLNKVKEYDTLSYKPWMKTFLYLSGGDNERNRVDWAVYLKSIVSPYIIDSDFCGDTTSVAKVDPTIGGEAESTRIKEKINSGAFWTTFFGHSSPTVFDMDGWHVDRLNNKGKFGILTTLSCNVGAFAEPFDNSRNRDYIMYPDKGFVAACGSSATGVISAEWNAFNFMLIALTEPDINLRRVGDVLYYSKSKMFQKGESAWNIMHFNLLGDPLVRFRVDTVPNLFIQAQDIKIQNLRNETLISEADSVIKISGVVYNAGVCQKGPVDLLILISYQSQIDSIRVHFESVCRFAPFECFLTIKNKPGNHNFTFIVDPDYQTIDPDRSNNVYATSLEVFTQYLLPLEPLAFWDVKQTGHFFRVINPISSSGEFSYKFDIKKSKDTSSVSIRTSKENEITIKENYIDWKPGLRFDDNSGYWFFASSVRKSNNEKSPPLIIPFTAKSLRDETKAEWTQLNTTHFSENHFENLEINGSIDTAEITLTKKVIPYKIIGINGDQKDYERFVEIDYNNKPIITSPNVSQAPVGINMLVVSAIDGSIKERKYYYTWSDDSSSTYFNRYMRDTVTTDDYVLLATCDQSFRMFWETDSTKVGSKDTLKAILHEFGSVLIDSVNKFNSSFVMFGRKGSKQGTIQEDLDTSGGIATVQGEIIFPDSTGKLITPYIGPARKWERFKAIASGLDSNSKITINVFGHNENSFEDTLLITSNSLTFSLSEIPAQIFPKIKIEVKLDRYVNTANPIITGLSCLYVPLPEFAVLQSQTKIQIDSVMRGEKTAIQTTVGNISKRVQSDSTTLDILLNPESVPELFSEPIPPLAVDQSESVVQSLATKNLELVNTVKIVVNPLKNQNELYSFNNY
ncbi:MAG: C25 family cysteine peptidase, partial [Bacteroidota bacterium]